MHQHDDNSIENTNPDYYKQELASRDEIIARLKEDASRLADCVENSRETPNSMCLVQHRALMKKLEEK